MLVLFGAAFLCFGVALINRAGFPAAYGWAATAGGLGSSVAALLQIANTGEVQAAETLFLASSLLITAWAFAIGLLLLRDSEGRLQSHVGAAARRGRETVAG